MAKYYCVTTTCYDSGRVSAAITNSIEAAKKPQNTYTSTSRRDIYNDWFGDYAEARQFAASAAEA